MALVHVPYTVEQDETGWYCAHASFVTDEVNGGANGEGATLEEAVADLQEALRGMIAAFGPPRDQQLLTIEVA
jgi:predicted RNase H-like HicB family nuclease